MHENENDIKGQGWNSLSSRTLKREIKNRPFRWRGTRVHHEYTI